MGARPVFATIQGINWTKCKAWKFLAQPAMLMCSFMLQCDCLHLWMIWTPILFCYYILFTRKLNLNKTTLSFVGSSRVHNSLSIEAEWVWASPRALLLACLDIFSLGAFYLMNSGAGKPRRPSSKKNCRCRTWHHPGCLFIVQKIPLLPHFNHLMWLPCFAPHQSDLPSSLDTPLILLRCSAS